MDSFGTRLKELRKSKGMSQDQLAEILSVRSGKQTISNWENSKSEPSLSEIRKIADALKTTSAYLVDGVDVGEKKIEGDGFEPPFGFMLLPASEVAELHRELNAFRKKDQA